MRREIKVTTFDGLEHERAPDAARHGVERGDGDGRERHAAPAATGLAVRAQLPLRERPLDEHDALRPIDVAPFERDPLRWA